MLITRHVEKLLTRPDKEKVTQLLAKAGLTFDGKVVHGDGPITARECGTYKRAVRAVYGDTTYSFAKVNFLLGGCSCEECAT
jgi:hypothetical protein